MHFSDLLITLLIILCIYGMFHVVYHRSRYPNISPNLILVSPSDTNSLSDFSFPEYTGSYTCYLINLDVDIVRLQHFLQSYLKSGLSQHTLIRVPGIIGKSLPMRDYLTPQAYTELLDIETTGYRLYHHQLTRGAVGCYESHLKAMDLIYDSPHPFGIIFEDDAVINSAITDTIEYMLSVVPSDWNMIVLGSINAFYVTYPEYRKLLTFWGGFCYIVNKSGIEIMRKHGGKPYDRQLDHKWCQLIREGKLKAYAPPRDAAWQSRRFGSHIQTEILEIPGVNPYHKIDDI
jgi:GR25 family glycosyltransferase involved in LPS biosynthesis